MGFRFRRTIKILPGIKLNLGKKGVSLSAGVRGAHLTFSKDGARTTVGEPGTGMSYTKYTPYHGANSAAAADSASVPFLRECPYCGHKMRRPWEACPECGHVLPQYQYCPGCGEMITRGNVNYCFHCGCRVRDDLITAKEIGVDLSQATEEEIKEKNGKWCECGILLFPQMKYCPICGKKNIGNSIFQSLDEWLQKKNEKMVAKRNAEAEARENDPDLKLRWLKRQKRLYTILVTSYSILGIVVALMNMALWQEGIPILLYFLNAMAMMGIVISIRKLRRFSAELKVLGSAEKEPVKEIDPARRLRTLRIKRVVTLIFLSVFGVLSFLWTVLCLIPTANGNPTIVYVLWALILAITGLLYKKYRSLKKKIKNLIVTT